MASSSSCTVVFGAALLLSAFLFLDQADVTAADDHYGHKGHGTACIVKGSYCQCHYCKCEKGWVHCDKHGYGKKYCFGSMEGQYCHCDFCKCSKGYGSVGYGKCH